MARYIAEAGRTYKTGLRPWLEFRLDRYLRGGDQFPFNQQGYAAVRFTEYREDYHRQHQNIRSENGIEYGDVTKCVNFDYVANVARVNAATLASLARHQRPPPKSACKPKNWKIIPRSPGTPLLEPILRSTVAVYNEPGMGTLGDRRKCNSRYSPDVEG